jgi:argininosuccinate lyase
MSRLWDKGEPLDGVVERFTVGRDPELDLRLVVFDALGSAAHARMLGRVGLLSDDDVTALVAELRQVVADVRAGDFTIAAQDEDGHTALENRLTERLGDAGRRIHAGRSRNDQVIATLRLFGREALLQVTEYLVAAGEQLCRLSEQHRAVAVPGYTHTRQAMPSTFGLLFGAYAEALVDDLPWLKTAYGHLNRSPLGSASGYGVPLPLDRPYVAELLGFDGVQANTLAVQNDRGKSEYLSLTAAMTPALDLARLASDLIWFSSEELGFVGLSTAITTGSSIMPQKRNPDVLELVRATGGRLRSRAQEVANVYGPLASGYHRDLQLTKEPFLEGIQGVLDVLQVMTKVFDSLTINEQACRDAMDPAIGATDAMCQRVARGEPLRLAYRAVGADPANALEGDPADAWQARTHVGAPGNLDLAPLRQALQAGRAWTMEQQDRLARVWEQVLA